MSGGGMIEYPFGAGPSLTRVIEAGTGDDAAIFVHGLGARADRWRQNLMVFADAGYHCYAVDLPGHGFAGKGNAVSHGVPGLADFLTDFLDAMGIARATLIGTSLGGHIAAAVACRDPDRVRALVLVGTLGLVPIGAEAGRAIRESVRNTTREAISGKLAFVLADSALATPELIEEEYRINNSPGAAESFARLGDYIANGVDDDIVADALRGLVGVLPIMLVWGGADKAVPLVVGEKSRSLLGDVPMLTIEGAGHAPYFEKADAFNGPVLKFLAGARRQ
jgi:2-hydroxy-6-oxonona-2,4-dienedioate hydrolase